MSKGKLLIKMLVLLMAVVLLGASAMADDAVALDKTDKDAGFACIVSEAGEVYWQVDIDSCATLMKKCDLADDGSNFAIHVIPDNDEEFLYLHPESDWVMLGYNADTPAWFTAELQASAWAAFEEWKDTVYGIFDAEGLRSVRTEDALSVAPTAADYEPTEEEMAAFLKSARDTNAIVTYIRDSVLNTIQATVGKTISDDAYNYIQVIRSESGVSKKIGDAFSNAGYVVSNVGVVQSNFFATICGAYFDIDTWTYYPEDTDGYPYAPAMYLWEHGLVFSQDSDTFWHLHSLNEGEILVTVTDDEVSVKNAFAALVDEAGTVYWALGADNGDAIRAHLVLAGDDYAEVQVKPMLTKEEASYVLIDGNNRDATIIFPYLDEMSTWTVLVHNEEVPAWYSDKYDEAILAACDEWKALVYGGFNFEASHDAFTEETRTVADYTEEDIKLLAEWAAVWNNIKDKGVSPTASITMSGYQSVSSNVWDDFGSYLLSCWRYVHSECPGSVVSSGFARYAGEEVASNKAIKTAVSDSVSDVWESVTGYYFSNVDRWEYYDGDVEGYPYAAGAELVLKNLVPCTDGISWYLCSGEDAEVVFTITADELLSGKYDR